MVAYGAAPSRVATINANSLFMFRTLTSKTSEEQKWFRPSQTAGRPQEIQRVPRLEGGDETIEVFLSLFRKMPIAGLTGGS